MPESEMPAFRWLMPESEMPAFRCKMPLPGNVKCPHVATYTVSTVKADLAYRRSVCVFHLVAAIDLDMMGTRIGGVRVMMTAFEEVSDG